MSETLSPSRMMLSEVTLPGGTSCGFDGCRDARAAGGRARTACWLGIGANASDSDVSSCGRTSCDRTSGITAAMARWADRFCTGMRFLFTRGEAVAVLLFFCVGCLGDGFATRVAFDLLRFTLGAAAALTAFFVFLRVADRVAGLPARVA